MKIFCIPLLLATIAISCRPAAEKAARPSEEALAGDAPCLTRTCRETVYPLEIRDGLGRTIVLKAEPRRIVTLLPSHTETAFAIGAGERVVGVDEFSDEPAAARTLPKLGGLYDARLESVALLAPDLVLASESSSALGALERSGITTWAGSAKGLDDVSSVIESIGSMLGRKQAARELARRVRDEIVHMAVSSSRREPTRVYFELDRALYTAGPASFIGSMIALAGGFDVIPAGLGEFPKVSPELIINSNPAVILGVSLEEAAQRPGWSAILAVQTGRVHALSAAETDVVVRPGPRLGEGLRVLSRLLQPDEPLNRPAADP